MLKTLQHIPRRLGAWLAAGIACLLMPACVNDDSPCPPEEDGEQDIYLQFTVVTHGISRGESRAPQWPTDPDKLQTGTAAENYIDIPGLTFLLFSDGEGAGDGTLLRYFTPEVKAVDGTGYQKYTVTANLTHKYFEDHKDDPTVSFRILVLANYNQTQKSIVNTGTTRWSSDPRNFGFGTGMQLSSFFPSDKVGSFAAPSDIWATWAPSIDGHNVKTSSFPDDNGWEGFKAYIPMAGLQSFTVRNVDLRNSSAENPLQLSGADDDKDIYMLRALAKIEVFDHIDAVLDENGKVKSQPAITDRPFIEKAELCGYFTRGSILPPYDNWVKGSDIQTQYPSATNIPSSAGFSQWHWDTKSLTEEQAKAQLALMDTKTLQFFLDEEESKKYGCNVFSCYVVEYNPENSLAKDYMMWIRPQIQNKYNPKKSVSRDDDVNESISYAIWMTGGTNAGKEDGERYSLLRNNIYRYEVTGINQEIQVNWHVCPMDEVTVDIPTFN